MSALKTRAYKVKIQIKVKLILVSCKPCSSDQYCFVSATGAVSILFGAMEQAYTRNVTVILAECANKQINVGT